MNGVATIKDVAERSNTSVGTVSRFLNGSKCGTLKKQRIEAAIRELNYVPNLHARAVRTLSSNCIGILIGETSLQDSFWVETLIFSMIQFISSVKYRSFIQIIDPSGENFEHLQLAGNMDGLILIGHFGNKFFDFLNEKGEIPAVTYWENLPYGNGSSIAIDLTDGMTDTAEHLLALGHRKIGLVTNDIKVNTEKAECFYSAIRRYIPDYDRSLMQTLDSGKPPYKYGAECTAALLDKHPDMTAIFYLSDSFLLGGLGELAQRRLRVPNDISVVSFDNSLIAVNTLPQITSVGFDYERLIAEMVTCLIAKIEDKKNSGVPVVPLRFYRRESTGSAAQSKK